MSCLYILEVKPLSVVSFAVVFFHSKGCFFTLLRVSFVVLKLLSLIRPHLFTFVFISVTVGGERQWQPTPVLLPGKSHGWRSLVGCSPWGREQSDWATSLLHFCWTPFLVLAPGTFHFHALEKEMATHSSILAWRILGEGEPDGLPSMGSHRVGHDWSDLAAAAAAAAKKLKSYI